MQIENKISIFEKIKFGFNEFYSGAKIYPKFYLTMLILFLISLIWWYASFAYTVFKLSNGFKFPGFGFLSSIGAIKFMIIFKYLAVVDNSTVTTLIFPISICCIFYYFHSLFRGKLNKVTKYPTGKYYQIITLQEEIISKKFNNNNAKFINNKIQEQNINKNHIFKKKLLPIHFPLFPSYRVTFLQLGLIGTLFAMTIAFQQTSRLREHRQPVHSTEVIVLAAEQDQGNVINDSNFETEDEIHEEKEAKRKEIEAADRIDTSTKGSAILLSALGTALWSSLMGIFIAFILGPFLIEPIGVSIVMNKFRNKMADYSMPEPIDIGNQFEKLNSKISDSNLGFEQLTSILGFSSKEESNDKLSVMEGFSTLNEELYKMNNNFLIANNLIDIKDKLNKIFLLSEEVESLNAKFNKIEEKIERMNSKNQNSLEEVNNRFKLYLDKLDKIDTGINMRVKEVTEQQTEIISKNITIQINEQEKNVRNENQALIKTQNDKILNEINLNNTKHEKEYDKLDDKINKLARINQDEIEQAIKKISEQMEEEKTTIQDELNKIKNNFIQIDKILKESSIKISEQLKSEIISKETEINNRFDTLLQKNSSQLFDKYSETKEAINDTNKTIKSLSVLINNSKEAMQQLSINLDRKILDFKNEIKKNALQMFQ